MVLPIKEQVEALLRVSVRVRTYIDVLWFYEEPSTYDAIERQIEEYYWFLGQIGFVYRLAAIVELAWLFDPGKRGLNLRSAITQSSDLLGEQRAGELIARIDVNDSLIKRVRDLRNSTYGHRDINISHDSAFDRASITIDDLRGLSQICLEISNALCQAHGLPQGAFLTQDVTRNLHEMHVRLGAALPREPEWWEEN